MLNNHNRIRCTHVGSLNASSVKEAIRLQIKADIDIISDGQIYFSMLEDDYIPFFVNEYREPVVKGIGLYSIKNVHDVLSLEDNISIESDAISNLVFVKRYCEAYEIIKNEVSSKQIKLILYSPLSLASRITYLVDEDKEDPDSWNRNMKKYLPSFKDFCKSIIEHVIDKGYKPDIVQIDQPVIEDYNLYKNLLLDQNSNIDDFCLINEIAEYCKKRDIEVAHYTPTALTIMNEGVKKAYKKLKVQWYIFNYLNYDSRGMLHNRDFFTENEIREGKKLCLGVINSWTHEIENETKEQAIIQLVKHAEERYGRENIMLSPNAGMKGIRNKYIIQQKLHLLSKIARSL